MKIDTNATPKHHGINANLLQQNSKIFEVAHSCCKWKIAHIATILQKSCNMIPYGNQNSGVAIVWHDIRGESL